MYIHAKSHTIYVHGMEVLGNRLNKLLSLMVMYITMELKINKSDINFEYFITLTLSNGSIN